MRNLQTLTPPSTTKLQFLIVFIFLLNALFAIAQNRQDYYVSIKPEFALGTFQKTTNADETITFTMNNTDFAAFLNSKPVYYFGKAFPTAVLEKNKRVYKITLDNNSHLSDFFNREEVEFVEIIEDLDIALYIPNDYNYIDREGPNTALELIKAPLAWNITTGDPNMMAGVYDNYFNIQHEDIENKIVQIFTGANLNPDQNGNYHGTTVSTALAGETDNNTGVASVGYNTNLVITTGGGANKILQLSQLPGVRVINISMKWGCVYFQAYENILEEVWNGNELHPPVVIIAAAGNGKAAQAANNNGYCGEDGNGYVYPAAYNHVIAVSALGHLVPRGTDDIFYNYGVSWEDVARSDINNPNSTTTHNDKVDLSAPGRHVLTANHGTNSYSRHSGTSLASPIVAGAAALILDVNPSLTSNQVRDVLKNTTDEIYHIPENIEYTNLYGTGRLNVYRAVLTAKCMADPDYAPNLDLMIRNSIADYGDEPDVNTGNVLWNSQEIWVRNQQDGKEVRVHQNPEYDPVIPNYVNVRVTNRSCVTSSGNEELTLYWAKANTALNWPNHWDGSLVMADITDSNSQTPVGGVVGTLNIPPLEPGQEAIVEFEWMVPNPEDYYEINDNPWHFCLLARIESPNDPMTFLEGTHITDNVRNNNNIAWKNTTVVDIVPNTPTIGGLVAVSNPFTSSKTYTLELFPEAGEFGKALYEEAEIGIEMDEVLYQAWSRGNKEKSHLKATSNDKKFIVSDSLARLENIQFYPNEYGTVYVTFNFLTKEISNKRNYTYHLAQIDASSNKVIGGETFEIRKQPRPGFMANAGNDEEIDRSESVTLQASEINEDAVYNWYDVEGNLIYSGTTITVSPQFTQQYKLEVISNLDGLKDYDELLVIVNPYKIQSLVPNPATSTVTVNYMAEDANSAYLMVVHQNSGNTSNYIIDVEESSHAIDLSNFATGLYSIILVCDGEIQGSKNLIKN